jgi:hypothetical protein
VPVLPECGAAADTRPERHARRGERAVTRQAVRLGLGERMGLSCFNDSTPTPLHFTLLQGVSCRCCSLEAHTACLGARKLDYSPPTSPSPSVRGHDCDSRLVASSLLSHIISAASYV